MASKNPSQRFLSLDDDVKRVSPHRPLRWKEMIKAAIRVFAESPLPEATVEQLAAECGVDPTTLYDYFGSKEELFDEAFKTCMRGMSTSINQERDRALHLT